MGGVGAIVFGVNGVVDGTTQVFNRSGGFDMIGTVAGGYGRWMYGETGEKMARFGCGAGGLFFELGSAGGYCKFLRTASFSQLPAATRAALSRAYAKVLTRGISPNQVVQSASRLSGKGKITAGARAVAKKLGHAQKGGYASAFEGVAQTDQAAVAVIRNILSNPTRLAAGKKTIDIYNAVGQGVRIERGTNRFIGFLELVRATR